MENSYRAELVGIFGNSADKNPTAVMMEAGFQSQNLNYRYVTVGVEKNDLEAAIKAMRIFGMRGIQLTMPHRVDVIPFLDELSPAAEIIGAVNSVCNRDGKLLGENTDGKGFVTSLMENNVMLYGQNITILGAGNTARAVAVEAAISGAANIHIINRNEERGRALTRLVSEKTNANSDFILWKESPVIPEDTDILVNCTSVGLFPEDNRPDIDYSSIQKHMVVCDVVLTPLETNFLKEAKKQGAKTVSGLGMLLNQATLNYCLWTEHIAPREVMLEALKKEFGLEETDSLKKPDERTQNRILIEKMVKYFAGDAKRIQHFLKVYEFAALIGEKEELPPEELFILKTAAIVHDIGIRKSEEKYGCSNGKYQEQEGPAAAEPMLKECGYEDEIIDRVLYLIAHHHTYHDISGMDYQILVEADFLVNLFEDHAEEKVIKNVREKIFRTKTGLWYLDTLFLDETVCYQGSLIENRQN